MPERRRSVTTAERLGRMLVIVLKAIPRVGSRISLRAEQLTYAIGFIALFTFLIWITVFDIARQVGGGAP